MTSMPWSGAMDPNRYGRISNPTRKREYVFWPWMGGEGFERSTWTYGWDHPMIRPRAPLISLQISTLELVHFARLVGPVPFTKSILNREGLTNVWCLICKELLCLGHIMMLTSLLQDHNTSNTFAINSLSPKIQYGGHSWTNH